MTYNAIDDIECDMFMFANDTSILEIITNPKTSFERVNRDLAKMKTWSELWFVKFNPTKTN